MRRSIDGLARLVEPLFNASPFSELVNFSILRTDLTQRGAHDLRMDAPTRLDREFAFQGEFA
ncbi:hypothetical protein EPO05_07345 [Patescibacteria group bacterium]|nr:MAG: hypothetical protein EPO05_07345 [Patescibacteria group bacterium]